MRVKFISSSLSFFAVLKQFKFVMGDCIFFNFCPILQNMHVEAYIFNSVEESHDCVWTYKQGAETLWSLPETQLTHNSEYKCMLLGP